MKVYPLFLSSLFMVVGNVPFIIISQEIVKKYICGIGLITSVLNHYYQSKYRPFQIMDRTIMTGGSVVYLLFYIDSYVEFMLWYSAFCSYFFTKYLKRKGFEYFYITHVFAHIFLTFLHNKLLF